jgi:D-amino peptidase
MGVRSIFLSGDAEICRIASAAASGIRTVSTKRGFGAAAAQVPRAQVLRELAAQTKDAVAHAKEIPPMPLPEKFEYVASYKDLKMAYRMSFYPGMQRVDASTLRLVSDRWMDIVTAHSFVVY